MPYTPDYTRVSNSIPQQAASDDPYGATHDAPEAIEFGRLVDDGQRTVRLRYGGENHVLIFGKSGQGKDTRLIIPSLLRMRGKRSVVAVDPKGEMAAVTAPQRAKYGRVVILNPFSVICDHFGYDYMEGCGFNPLCSLDPSSPGFNVDAGLLAEALIPMNAEVKDPHWPLSGRALVGGLIMYEVVKAQQEGRDPQLFNVRRMIGEAVQPAKLPMIIGGVVMGEETAATGIPAYAIEMAKSVIIGMRNKAGQFIDWTKEVQSIASTVRTETEFLDDVEIAYSLAQNDFDFAEVKRQPTTVYLVLPMKMMQRHGKWLRLILTTALQACMRPRTQHEPRTLFIFNEFAALGHLQLIEDNFTVVRGAGIQMMPVLQDLNQLQQIYNKRWQTFIANSDITATFAPNDTETAEWFSKRCGETSKLKIAVTKNWSQSGGNSQNQGLSATGETSGSGTSGGWSYNQSENHSYEKEPAVTTYELFNMQPGEMRIIRAGMADTFHAHALPYWEMRNLFAETSPPENPYNPNADIPRIAPRMPDYAAFQRRMLNVYQPVVETRGGASGGAMAWGKPLMPNPPNPAGSDYVDNRTGDDLPKADPGRNFFSGLRSSGASNAPQGNSGDIDKSGGDDWHAPQVERPAQAEPKPQAAPAQASLWLNPSAYVDRIGRGAAAAAGSNRTPPSPSAQGNSAVNINVTFVNSGSGTMNVNFGNGAVQGNSAVYQPGASTRTPSPAPAPAPAPENRQKAGYWQKAEWQEGSRDDLSIPAPPAAPARPLALPAPRRGTMQPQAPDSISDGVQARHPGYAPDPAKTLANYAAWRTKPTPDQPQSPKPKRGRRKQQ